MHNVCAVQRGVCNAPGNVQYTGGLSWVQWGTQWVHWGVIHEYSEGYHEYTRGSSVHCGLTMINVGDIMSTLGMLSTLGDTMSTPGVYHDECGGYHEYTGGCSVHWGDIMSTPGVFSTLGGYHEYTRGIPRCMWGVIMSTLMGVQYTGGIPWVYQGFRYEWEKATTRFWGFLFSHLLRPCSCICWPLEHQTACYKFLHQMTSQSPDPNILCLIRSLQFQNMSSILCML